MRSAAVAAFEVVGVFNHGKHFETVVAKSEQSTDSHVVDAAFLGAVHHGETVGVVGLGGAFGVETFVQHGVVGLLETYVGAYLFGVQTCEILHLHGCQLDVDTTDVVAAAAFFHAVGGAYGLHHVVGAVFVVLAADEQHTFVTLFQQSRSLLCDLVHGEYLTGNQLVVLAERAVGAVVHADIAGVDGGEKHQTFAVDLLFHNFGGVHNLLDMVHILHAEQQGHVFEAQPFQFQGFVENVVKLVLCRDFPVYQGVEFITVDKHFVAFFDIHIIMY